MLVLYMFLILLAALIAALAVAVIRTLLLPRKQTAYVPSADEKRIAVMKRIIEEAEGKQHASDQA